jgi:hypothetical protein
MSTWVALDLSLSSTGFASWSSDDAALTHGRWALADSMKWRGRGYVRLHKALLEIHGATPIDHLIFEEPLTPASVSGHTNIDTLQTLAGLAAHAESFAAAVKAVPRPVNVATWRRHFIGPMPRGTKSLDLKAMTIKRCRELGFSPVSNDEADAIGLLDFALHQDGITPPWRFDNVLTRQMLPGTDGRKVA